MGTSPAAAKPPSTQESEKEDAPLLAAAPDAAAPNAAIAPEVAAPNAVVVEETQADRPEGMRLGVTIAQHPCQRAV